MPVHLLLFSICYLLPIFYCLEIDEGLVGVAVIYRHGDRTPIKTYPTDPYSNASYWPVGFGELTNIGKMHLFELGKWFRNRYQTYLSDQYSSKEIYVLSTDVSRTLMSAQLNLAGLFPPRGRQIWNNNLTWQPIPVHTMPETEDNILRMKMPCAKHKYLYDHLLESDEFLEINKRNHDLYEYLSNYSGMSIKNIPDVEHLYSTLYVENMNNLTLPEWTKLVFPDKMSPWAHLAFALKCYTPQLARLKSGPLLNHIFENFLKRTNRKGYKFVAYSAHDTTVANILTSLNVFEYHTPPYGATIFFELRYLNDSYFVNIFYKNSSVVQKLFLKDCEFLCPLKTFRKILKPLLITPDQWHQECLLPNRIFSIASFSSVNIFIFLIMFFLLGFYILAVCIKGKIARYHYRILE